MLRQASARRYRGWVFSMLSSLFVVQAWGQAEDCTQLPEARQTMCWMVLSCSTLDDAEDRHACFQAAFESSRSSSESEIAGDTAAKEGTLSSEPTEHLQSSEIPGSVLDVEPLETSPSVAQETPSSSDLVIETREQRTVSVFEIPKQFSGEITGLRKLVRDRQILAVDGQLVFEGHRADASGLQVGDQVDVQRISRLFSDRYEIVGPSKGRFTASRVRCEKMDLPPDSRRKCSSLLPE